MTKMAAMPIYGKNPSNIFFSETNRLISMKLGVKHPWLQYYNVYINHDPVMTKFMARSTWVAHAFEWEKVLKCHLKGKASKKLANGQNIDYSEKRKWPKGFICPCTGVKYHNIQTCLLVYAADSGERLQDHWSSGYKFQSELLLPGLFDPLMSIFCKFWIALIQFGSYSKIFFWHSHF